MTWHKGKRPGPMAGKHHTEQTRLKMSLSHKGKKHSPEHRQHIIDACRNNPKLRGYHWSDATKKRFRKRLRQYWRERRKREREELNKL